MRPVNLTDTDAAFAADADAVLRDAVRRRVPTTRAKSIPASPFDAQLLQGGEPHAADPGESCPEHAGTGFVADTRPAETSAVYANTIDLGFGRDMHCVQNGADVACYVSNYD